jgi:hypothetical protein
VASHSPAADIARPAPRSRDRARAITPNGTATTATSLSSGHSGSADGCDTAGTALRRAASRRALRVVRAALSVIARIRAAAAVLLRDRQGGVQVINQRVQVGFAHRRTIVTVEIDETVLRLFDEHDKLIKAVPRTSREEVTRHKAYGRKNRAQA